MTIIRRSDAERAADRGLRHRAWSPMRWAMWSVARPRWIAYALASEAAAVAVTVVSLAGEWSNRTDATWFVVLLLLGVAQGEMSGQIERVRRWMGGQTHINVTSVWYLAGVVLLSPGWVSLLAAALYLHLWLRVWRHVKTRPAHRVVASTAWALLSCWAASFILHRYGFGSLADVPPAAAEGAIIVLVAAAVFELVNVLVVATGIYLYTHKRSISDLLGTWGDNALELVTLCLGGLTAIALVYQPALAVLVFPPLVLLHRQVLIKQLEEAASTDGKTGLFNTVGWHRLAARELTRAERAGASVGVFMLDMDHFKYVNDTYGHPVGDTVIRAVGDTISASVRDSDTVARFGGDEFVVLLPNVAEDDMCAIAERVRRAVAHLTVNVVDGDEQRTIANLSVSIGTAMYPTAGTGLDRLIEAADMALYRAKRASRNRVVSFADTGIT